MLFRSKDPIARSWDIFCKRLARHGLPRAAWEGPADYAARISTLRPELAEVHPYQHPDTLQGVLGNSWAIARISKTRFACIGMGEARSSDVLAVATQVLAHSARMTDAIGPVAEFDLRIACMQRRLTRASASRRSAVNCVASR